MIRTLRRDDLPALIEMERMAAPAAHWSQAEYENLLTPATTTLRKTWVAEKHGHPTGFIVAKVLGQDWEIENVIVSPECRRNGIGLLLMSQLVQEAKSHGAHQILLEVRSRNTAARMLYAKCGFSVIGHRRAYYLDPVDDALLYKLGLSDPAKGDL